MRKVTALLLLAFLSMSSTCENDDAEEQAVGTLFVDGVPFLLGTNGPTGSFNTTLFQPGVPTSPGSTAQRSFLMTNTNLSGTSINVYVNYPAAAANCNGTYDLSADPLTATSFGLCHYITATNTFGGDATFASGNIVVTDNGSSNYTLTFNNVVVKDNANPSVTKTITGYCQVTFNQI